MKSALFQHPARPSLGIGRLTVRRRRLADTRGARLRRRALSCVLGMFTSFGVKVPSPT
jgi:hypothetical protein